MPIPPDDTPQSVLLDRFEVGKWVARGGMSNVYHAMDRLGLHPQCVVKVANSERSSSWIHQEAALLQTLRHRNIVSLLDHGVDQRGRAILALEYIDGPSFKQVLQQGSWKTTDVLRWFSEICAALTLAHQHGIIHGDLKPANIRIRKRDGSVCLLDFGLHAPEALRLVEPEKNAVLGSPRFIAPEHVRGDALDPRADVYGLGVLLFRTLTGAYPFQGQTKIETLAGHLLHPVPTFKSKAKKPIIGGELEEIVRRCLAKEPGERFSTPAAVYEAMAARLPSQ